MNGCDGSAGGRVLKIVWDERKRLVNLSGRQMDFADLTLEFFAEAVITGAKERRFKATGMFDGQLVTVIFRPMGREAISVISMRRASRKERSVQ